MLQVVSAQIDAKQLPQYEFGRVAAAVVVRNQAVAQHEQGCEPQKQVANARRLHDSEGVDRTRCHTRQAKTALTR